MTFRSCSFIDPSQPQSPECYGRNVPISTLFHGTYADQLKRPGQYWTVLVAVLGGGVGWWFAIPAPWLTGAMAATIALAATGRGGALSSPLRDVGMLFSGLTLGAAVTPETLQAFVTVPLSLLGLAVTSLTVMIVTSAVLIKFSGWERRDAVLAATPGALSAVMAVAVDEGADVPRIAIVQLFRLVMLVAVLPSLLVLAGLSGSPQSITQPAMDGLTLLFVIGLGLAGGIGFRMLNMSAPFVLGPLVVVGLLRGAGFFPGQYPMALATLGFVLIGALIGGRFEGMRARQIAAIGPAALLSFFVSTFIAFIGAFLVAHIVGFPLPEALIAFAPGALEAMTALAFSLHIDPVIVGVHHIARFMLIGIGLPLAMKIKPELIRGSAP